MIGFLSSSVSVSDASQGGCRRNVLHVETSRNRSCYVQGDTCQSVSEGDQLDWSLRQDSCANPYHVLSCFLCIIHSFVALNSPLLLPRLWFCSVHTIHSKICVFPGTFTTSTTIEKKIAVMMRWRSAEREIASTGEGAEDITLRQCASLDEDEPDSSSPDPSPKEKEPHRGRLETTSETEERLVPADGHFEDDHSHHQTLEEEKKQSEDTEPEEPPDPVIEDDDDGSDHAEPPKVPWKPQNVQSTCEFTHTITDYAQKRESGCKKAEYSATTVDDFGNRWRLIVYVNGNGRASNHHLSLFLQVADADDLPFGWKKAVSYVLTLEHPNGGTQSYAKRNPDKTFKLCPKAIDWGWSQFITSDRIQQEGFVANDKLTVRASVSVKSSSVSIDEEDSELYLKCAVEEGNAEAVKLCIEQGASVNCKFKDDLYTPLHTACSSGTSRGSMEVLNLLLEQGADGNACNKWRETPLLIAANNGHLAAVEALIKHGANPSLCSEAGWSALTFAAHKVC